MDALSNVEGTIQPTILQIPMRVWWESGVGADIEFCDGIQNAVDACYHCAQKNLIANVAMGWAFDLGRFGG